MGVSIIGSGSYLPKTIATNLDFEKLVETSDEWITKRTGIKTRHIATDENTCQMGQKAALAAIKNANISPEDIDLILVTTVTSDYNTPSAACVIGNLIGAYNAVCMDINAACSGFVFAMDMANKYLKDGEYKTALVVSTEMLSKITDYEDRSTCVLFGDGAGACVLKKSDNLFESFLGCDTKGTSLLFARGVQPDNPFMEKKYDRLSDGYADIKGHYLYMDGKEVYKFAVKAMPNAVEQVCKKANINLTELELIIPHQANVRIVETAIKHLNLPREKFLINIKDYGNMSSACIPIALSQALSEGRVKKGDKVCLVGFGGGLTYGAVVLEI